MIGQLNELIEQNRQQKAQLLSGLKVFQPCAALPVIGLSCHQGATRDGLSTGHFSAFSSLLQLMRTHRQWKHTLSSLDQEVKLFPEIAIQHHVETYEEYLDRAGKVLTQLVQQKEVLISVAGTRELRVVYLDILKALDRKVLMVKVNKRLDDHALYDGCRLSQRCSDTYSFLNHPHIQHHFFIGPSCLPQTLSNCSLLSCPSDYSLLEHLVARNPESTVYVQVSVECLHLTHFQGQNRDHLPGMSMDQLVKHLGCILEVLHSSSNRIVFEITDFNPVLEKRNSGGAVLELVGMAMERLQRKYRVDLTSALN